MRSLLVLSVLQRRLSPVTCIDIIDELATNQFLSTTQSTKKRKKSPHFPHHFLFCRLRWHQVPATPLWAGGGGRRRSPRISALHGIRKGGYSGIWSPRKGG